MSGGGKWTPHHELAFVSLASPVGRRTLTYKALPLVMKDNIKLDDTAMTTTTSPKASKEVTADQEEAELTTSLEAKVQESEEKEDSSTIKIEETSILKSSLELEAEEESVTEQSQESPTTTPLEPRRPQSSTSSWKIKALDGRYKLQTILRRLSQQRRSQKDLETEEKSTTSPKLHWATEAAALASASSLATTTTACSTATSEAEDLVEKMSSPPPPPPSHQQSHQANSLDPMTTNKAAEPKESWHAETEVAWDTSSHYFVGELPSQTLLSPAPALEHQQTAKRTIAEFILICFAVLAAILCLAVSIILAFKRLLRKTTPDFYGIKQQDSSSQKYKFTALSQNSEEKNSEDISKVQA